MGTESFKEGDDKDLDFTKQAPKDFYDLDFAKLAGKYAVGNSEKTNSLATEIPIRVDSSLKDEAAAEKGSADEETDIYAKFEAKSKSSDRASRYDVLR